MAPMAEKKPASKKPMEEEPAAEKVQKTLAGKKPKAEKRLPMGKKPKDEKRLPAGKTTAKEGRKLAGESTVCLVLPDELTKHAVSEGTKAITKFTSP